MCLQPSVVLCDTDACVDCSVGRLTSASLDQLKDLSALDGCGIFFFFRDGPMGAPGGGGTPLRGGRPGGGGPPGGGGGGGGGGGIMAPGRGGGGGAGPPKLGNGGGGRGPPGGPGMRGGPPGTTACLWRRGNRQEGTGISQIPLT